MTVLAEQSRRLSEGRIGSVIEDVVTALVGLALLVYLGYALARPERF